MILATSLAFLSSAFQSPLAAPADESPSFPAVVYVRGEAGLEPIRAVLNGYAHALVPLHSRSERRPRAALGRQGIEIVLYAGSDAPGPCDEVDRVRVRVIEHPIDAQVFFTEIWELVRVGPPILPLSARDGLTGRDVLPELARQDANHLAGPRVSIAPPGGVRGMRLVLVPAEADPLTWWQGSDSVTTLRAFDGESPPPAEIDTAQAPLDQAFFAHVASLEREAGRELALRTAKLRSARATGWEPRRGEGPSWPVIELGVANASAPAELAARLREEDGSAAAAPAEQALELEFEVAGAPPAGSTWTLLVEVTPRKRGLSVLCDQPPYGTWPAPARRDTGLFRDVARESGISMVHLEGPDEQQDIRPTMGPGAAWGDADGDGWVDLFLPQGGGREGSARPKSRFYRNLGDGRFADESEARGLALEGAGMGALFFDADGDGDLDLFVANYGLNRFLENDGRGRFADRSAEVGLSGSRWHAAVSAADYDRDGDLDLYVTSYLQYDPAKMPPAEELDRYQREDPIEMLPFVFPGERKELLRNDRVVPRAHEEGGVAPLPFVFFDAAPELGLDDPNGRGMQAVFWDFDRDGDQDLYLANDVSPNRFWRNEGNGTFKDVSLGTGTDDPRGSMGLAAADVDGDGDEDLFVTNWQLEANALYTNNLVSRSARSRLATFRDTAVQAGLAQLKVGVTAWGCELADFDLDGDLDLFYANGYTSPDYESTGICVGQPCHYFEGDGTGRFAPAFEKAGPDVALPLAARAAQACDYDQDGDLDLVVTANNGRVRLLRNELEHGKRHWLGVRLRGRGGNTFGIGAEVEVRAGERVLRRSLRAGTSYLGGNAPELHFGLGEAAEVDALVVRWPSGSESTHAVAEVDRFVTIEEPAGEEGR